MLSPFKVSRAEHLRWSSRRNHMEMSYLNFYFSWKVHKVCHSRHSCNPYEYPCMMRSAWSSRSWPAYLSYWKLTLRPNSIICPAFLTTLHIVSSRFAGIAFLAINYLCFILYNYCCDCPAGQTCSVMYYCREQLSLSLFVWKESWYDLSASVGWRLSHSLWSSKHGKGLSCWNHL